MFNHEPKGYKCPLCIFAMGGETDFNKRSDIFFETDTVIAYVAPKWWKNNPGNVMVIPRKHIENVFDMSDDLLGEVSVVGKKVAFAMKQTYACDGISFRQHNEPSGGQEVWHYHLHVFPRWAGDDLYLNNNSTHGTTTEDRLPYAEKLRSYFAQNHN